MTKLTFVIPVAGYHQDVARQAIESVKAQTIPCELIVIQDTDGRGAGWARNKGLQQVQTTHVTFLDADDTIDPKFAEITLGALAHYMQSGRGDSRYIYTDWLGVQNIVHKAPEPCDAWTNGTFHLVTTVLPVDRVRLIGGFDEVMTGVEDTDFYVRLRLSGVCGIHVNAPLVHYREGGQRSVSARQSGKEAAAKLYMTQRYGGYSFMGCCGDSTPGPTGPTNEPLEGDVLAQALWHGNRQERGRVTGRLYPRTSYPKMLYVSEADVQVAPQHWKRINSPQQATNGVILQPQYASEGNWQDVADALFGGGSVAPQSKPVEYKPHGVGRSKKDVVATAQEWTRVEGSLE
jgi:hypothetical protein